MKEKSIETASIAMIILLSATVIFTTTIQSVEASDSLTKLWSYGTGGGILDIKSIPDVNGDGKDDVVAGSSDNNIYILNGVTGSKIWNNLTGGDVVSVDYVDDITGDGIVEIVAGSTDTKVYLLNGATGKQIWAEPIRRSPPIYKVSAIADVTGDGKKDIVAGGMQSYEVVECKNSTDGTTHWYQEYYGSYRRSDDFTILSDVTGDGKPDVIWAYGYRGRYMRLINGATGGTEITRTDLPDHDSWVSLLRVPDVSGDGYDDVVNIRVDKGVLPGARTLILSGPNLEEFRRFEETAVASDERMWDANYISDITADGRPEVIIGWKNKILCKNAANGVEIWNTTVTNGNSEFTYSHRITEGRDISGDGIDDIVVGVENGKVYFLGGEDGTSVLDPYQIGGSANSVALLADVTGDTVPEILVGGGDYFVYCLTSDEEGIPTKIEFVLDPSLATPGETVMLSGNLTELDDDPIYPAAVDVDYSTDGGTTWKDAWTLYTNMAGEFSKYFSAPGIGTYLVRARYLGSATYESSSHTEALIVDGGLTTSWIYFIFKPSASVSPGQAVTLKGILIDDSSNPITSANVKVEYSTNDGTTWNTAWKLTTNQYGIFSQGFTAPSAGRYLVKVSYVGSSTYKPTDSNAYFIVR